MRGFDFTQLVENAALATKSSQDPGVKRSQAIKLAMDVFGDTLTTEARVKVWKRVRQLEMEGQ